MPALLVKDVRIIRLRVRVVRKRKKTERIDAIEVECGELVEIHLVAPPCPASPPSSAVTSLTINEEGLKVVTGESVVLEVSGVDRCGNVGSAQFDPAVEPAPPPCAQVLPDGSCCPAIAPPDPPDCEPDGPCGTDGG